MNNINILQTMRSAQNLAKIAIGEYDLETLTKNIISIYDTYKEFGDVSELRDDSIELKGKSVIFSLYSYTIYQAIKNDEGNMQQIKTILDILDRYLPTNIRDFTKIFINCTREEEIDYWGWSFFISRGPGVYVGLTTEEFLYYGFLYYLFKISEQDDMELDFKDFSDEENQLICNSYPALKNVTENENIENFTNISDYTFPINETSEKVNKFMALIKNQCDKNRSDKIINEKISSEDKHEIIEDFMNSVKDASLFRHILDESQIINKEIETVDKWFSISELVPKEFFLKDYLTIPDRLGKELGYGMGSSETAVILNEIKKIVNQFPLNEFQKIIKSIGNIKDYVLIFANYTPRIFFNEFNLSSDFVPDWNQEPEKNIIKSLKGYFNINSVDVPIYAIRNKSLKKNIYFINKEDIGQIIQYNVKENLGYQKIEYFRYSIQVFSEDESLIENFIENQKDYFTKEESIVDKKFHLKTRVWLEIAESFEFKRNKESSVYCFE